jgi:hypothetical protein
MHRIFLGVLGAHKHLISNHSAIAGLGSLPSSFSATLSIVPAAEPTPVSSLTPSIVNALAIASPTSNVVTHQDKGVSLSNVFTKDYPPPLSPYNLPGPDERLVNTEQLALCLALLQTSLLTEDDALTPSARTWLTATGKNLEEQERLKAMATDVIRAYTRDELKDTNVTSEVVCLAPVLEKENYRILLSQLVDAVEGSLLLDVQAVEGLAQLLHGSSPGYLDADDLVKIIKLLNTRLQDTHRQSPQHIYQLTLTVSRVLDAMVDCEVKGLDRVNLHEPLLSYLEGLKSNKDPYMVFQAAYAYQALLFIPDNESPWQATLRRSGLVLKGLSGLVSAVKSLNINEFIEGLGHIQGGLEGVGQVYGLAKDAYKGVTTLMESGESLLDALKKGLSFSQKREWYPLLRGIDLLLQNGELSKFKTVVYEARCRRDLAFLWGTCQRLGDLASNSVWDDKARRDAIVFLSEIYRNDAEWGEEPQVKQCVLDILLHLRSTAGVVDQGNVGERGKGSLLL